MIGKTASGGWLRALPNSRLNALRNPLAPALRGPEALR